MKYFVFNNFEQNDGALSHTGVNFDNLMDAKMEYHAQLASHYNPTNRANNKWFSVQLMTQTGVVIRNEDFVQETDEVVERMRTK